MILFTVIIIYLIIGLLFTNMYSGMVRYIVANDKSGVNKNFLLLITIIHMTITFPYMIYKILKRDIQQFEEYRNKKERNNYK